jgi:hypothetical protein
MVCFIVFYIETFPILRLHTVMYVVYMMIYFFEIYIHEDRKGFYIKDNKTYHMDFKKIFLSIACLKKDSGYKYFKRKIQ